MPRSDWANRSSACFEISPPDIFRWKPSPTLHVEAEKLVGGEVRPTMRPRRCSQSCLRVIITNNILTWTQPKVFGQNVGFPPGKLCSIIDSICFLFPSQFVASSVRSEKLTSEVAERNFFFPLSKAIILHSQASQFPSSSSAGAFCKTFFISAFLRHQLKRAEKFQWEAPKRREVETRQSRSSQTSGDGLMEKSIQFDWGWANRARTKQTKRAKRLFTSAWLSYARHVVFGCCFNCFYRERESARGNNYETQTGVLSVFAASRLAGIRSVDKRAILSCS